MATSDVLIGDRYRLVRELGSGGMSVVWEAEDERLHRRVAVKQLRFEPGLGEEEAQTVAERAMREARINARLQHPNAVAIFDVVEHEGRPCLVMELVSARTLADVLRESASHTLGPSQVARIGSQIASALAAAHGLGIVHRDIKPSNILLGADDRARISDFGISRAVGDNTLTLTGMISGTPAYLAPEVARGGEPTAASDVFSLGATLYAAVEGGPPFGTDGNAIALLYRVAEGAIPTPRRAGELAPLLSRMLADPGVRPAMDEVAAALTDLSNTDHEPIGGEGAGVSTVAIQPPTGARLGRGVGAALGSGVAAEGVGGGSTVSPGTAPDLSGDEAQAATPTERAPGASPSAGDPPAPAHRSMRRGVITATVVVVVVAAVAVAGLLWQRSLAPGPNPTASALPGASQADTEKPADEPSGQTTQKAGSGGTKATDEPTTSGADREPSESTEPTQASRPTPTSERSAPSASSTTTEPQPGNGNGKGNGGGNGESDGNGKGNGNGNGNGKGNGNAEGKGNG